MSEKVRLHRGGTCSYSSNSWHTHEHGSYAHGGEWREVEVPPEIRDACCAVPSAGFACIANWYTTCKHSCHPTVCACGDPNRPHDTTKPKCKTCGGAPHSFDAPPDPPKCGAIRTKHYDCDLPLGHESLHECRRAGMSFLDSEVAKAPPKPREPRVLHFRTSAGGNNYWHDYEAGCCLRGDPFIRAVEIVPEEVRHYAWRDSNDVLINGDWIKLPDGWDK